MDMTELLLEEQRRTSALAFFLGYAHSAIENLREISHTDISKDKIIIEVRETCKRIIKEYEKANKAITQKPE